MYLNVFKLILFILDVFMPLVLLGLGYYSNDLTMLGIGKVWYGFNLIVTCIGLLRMWAFYSAIKLHFVTLRNLTPQDLTDIPVPVDIVPILYSQIFYYCIGIINISVLVYSENYIYLILYILCTAIFQDLISKFNKMTTKINREFQRCRELQRTQIKSP